MELLLNGVQPLDDVRRWTASRLQWRVHHQLLHHYAIFGVNLRGLTRALKDYFCRVKISIYNRDSAVKTYTPAAHFRKIRSARPHLQGTFAHQPANPLIYCDYLRAFSDLTGEGQSENWNGGNFQDRVVIISIKTLMVGYDCQTVRPMVDGLKAAHMTKIIQT